MLRQRKLVCRIVFVLIAGPIAAAAPASVLGDTAPPTDWSQATSAGPSGRIAPYMDYDSTRGRVVLFGGDESASQFDSDTWEFDGTSWRQVATSGPPAGAIGAIGFDSNRGVSVLFGGVNANSTLPAITWEWNGSSWAARFTATRPQARAWNAMVYDSVRHVIVMFGGAANGGGLKDTWEYYGNDWRQVLTAHSPPGRFGHGLAFDPVRNRTVLFGGWSPSSGRLNDTWEYDGTDWTQIAAANPPAPRWIHSMAYDAALGRVAVFGGDYLVQNSNGINTLGPNNETWLYDGAAWQHLATATEPSPRAMAGSAYDSARASFVIFGGTQEGFPQTPLTDAWMLHTPLPHASLSTGSIAFGLQPVLSVSTQTVTLTNAGDAPLAISSIEVSGSTDFTSTDGCPRSPTTLAVTASCTITVGFTPSTAAGGMTGAVTINDNADGGAQSIALTGSGQWGSLALSPSSIDFGSGPVFGSYTPVVETLTAAGVPTILTGFNPGGPFTIQNLDCPIGLLPAGSSCHVQVGFSPTTAGTFTATVAIRDDEPMSTHSVQVTGTALPLPVSIAIQVSPAGTSVPTYRHAITVVASTNASSGTATFTFNGVQLGAPQPINTSGSATETIPLDDSTIPDGAGTYSLTVSVQPLDDVHADGSATQPVTVVPEPEMLSWNGTGMAVAGSPATLAATVTPPPGASLFDFSTHPAWIRFDVTDGSGTVTTYFAQVANPGNASVSTAVLAPGAFSVQARFVTSSGSSAPSSYVGSEDLRAAFAEQPVRGGYISGADQEAAQKVAFEFSAGATPAGSLVWIAMVQVTGPQGDQRDAYRIITSTSVASVASHSHSATATGTASVVVIDSTNGVHYSAFDQTTTFQLTVASDGSVLIGTGAGLSASLPAGSGVNHL